MERAPAITLVLKATFFHAYVDPAGEDAFSPVAGVTSASRRRRAASQPSCRHGQARVPLAPLYVEDPSTSGWRRVAGDLPRAASAVASERDTPRVSRASTAPDLGAPVAHDGDSQSTGASEKQPQCARNFSNASTRAPSESLDAELSDREGVDAAAAADHSAPGLYAASADDDASGASGGSALTAGAQTTVMMRNLPTTYSRERLLQLLDGEGFGGRYDFLYLPMEFRSAASAGYAFVNLVSPADAQRFREHFQGFRRWGVTTRRACNVSWAAASQQGLEANIERYRNSSVMHKSVPEQCRPMLLVGGVPAAFPRNNKKLWPPHANFGSRAGQRGGR